MDTLAILREVTRKHGIKGRIAEIMRETFAILGDGAADLEGTLRASGEGAPGDVESVCAHILGAGGKRIRPAMCLLAYRACRGLDPLPIALAVSCELLHNASLLHDDVIDEGEVRRGRPSVRVVHGNALSVLGGDYLLMKCVETVSLARPGLMPDFVDTLRLLVEGEVVQLGLRGSIRTDERSYYRIIEGKTASLFAWASLSGAHAAAAEAGTMAAFRRFGWHVGVAFQLIDDVLDFSADADALGKGLLADIGEGKITLPVIFAAQRAGELDGLLRRLVEAEDPSDTAATIARCVTQTDALERVRGQAARHTALAADAIRDADGCDRRVADHLVSLAEALLLREM